MDIKQQLDLEKGQWVIANCGKIASEENCRAVFMAPNQQRNELLDTLVDHAVKQHGHKNSPELKTKLDKMLNVIEVR